MRLIPTPVPPDLHQAISDIADGVRDGSITGLGVVVVTRGRRFFVDAFGALVREPDASRGYVAALDDCLREISRKAKDSHTTI
jgi:hypothetical protein